MKILAVDDDPVVTGIMEIFLAEAKFDEAGFAVSGEEALRFLEDADTPFDCFLLDINMPGINGIELCRTIHSKPEYKNAPIIMITASQEKKLLEEAFQAGAIDYLNKPLDFVELRTRLRNAEEAVERNRKMRELSGQLSAMAHAVPHHEPFTISDPINLSEAPNVLRYLAIENYLLALSRFGAFKTQATGLAIVEFDEFFTKAEPDDVYYTLLDVAEAISHGLRGTEHLLSYCGYGTFLCISHRGENVFTQDLQFEIQGHIDALGLEYENGDKCDLNVVLGETERCSLWGASDPLRLAKSAIVSVRELRTRYRANNLKLFSSEEYSGMLPHHSRTH